jgi:hypothetical protein
MDRIATCFTQSEDQAKNTVRKASQIPRKLKKPPKPKNNEMNPPSIAAAHFHGCGWRGHRRTNDKKVSPIKNTELQLPEASSKMQSISSPNRS